MTRNKTTITIAILVFAMAFSLFASNSNAQPGVTLRTYPFIDAVPSPVGVGEDVLIRFGILQQLPSVADGYEGLTITVTKPDNTTQTLGPLKTDSTGGTATLYVPNAVGTYTLKLNYPEQVWKWGAFFNYEGGNMIFDGTVMQASTDTVNLVVQQDPLPKYPGHPLPAEYWTRPIDPQLREWYPISGNWVRRSDNSIALYNDDAPETAHVLWSKPLTTGGLTGGLWTGVPASSETGDAYEGKFPDSVVLNGVLYYNRADSPQSGIYAVDLHTGEELWFKNGTTLSFGQILYFNSWNYDGVFTYIWETAGGFGTPARWNAYDPFTGEWQLSFVDVPSGVAQTYGPSGEILIWQIDYENNWMALWNSTAAGQSIFTFEGDFGSWGTGYNHGQEINASTPKCYSWNVTIPAGLTAGLSFFSPILKVLPDRVVSMDFNRTRVRVWALGTTPTNRGQLLFDKSWNAPAEWFEGANTLHYVGATDYVEGGVIAIWNKELTTHYGFSLENGNYLWATESEHWLDAYGWGNAEHTWYFAYGKLFSVGVGGIVYAYDLATGDAVWTYEMTDAYGEPVTGQRWWGWITLIADGKVYVGTCEHSAEMPIPRGGPLICLDAETGAVVWRVNGMYRATRWGGNAVMGDSIYATMDTYDQQVWAVGKGPSATSVTIQDDVVTHGDSVLVKGMVTDTSAGTKSSALTTRFPNGVPAVSDNSQSEWMLYVYKQFECPTTASGVEVVIEVLDPNNNYYEVGRTTSDLTGFYKLAFTPEVPGEYTLVARFAGSKAYWPSFSETAINVEEAPAATPEPASTPTSLADQYILPGIGGIIAAIAIVGVVLALLLRKR